MSAHSSPYALLSFGKSRKIERFGSVVVDRPDPVAEYSSTHSQLRVDIDATFSGSRIGQGSWEFARQLSSPRLSLPNGTSETIIELVFADGGQVGLFPEHIEVWQQACQHIKNSSTALNLFGYSGVASVALAQRGCSQVTHVDASASAIDMCKRNANLNGVTNIRTICEDVLTYLRRAKKKGETFDIVLADPPAFGRKGSKTWKLERDLSKMLMSIDDVLSESGIAYVSGHTPGFERLLQGSLAGHETLKVSSRIPLHLTCESDVLHKGTCFVIKKVNR